MTYQTVSKEDEAKDRAESSLALHDAHEKMVYASVGGDEKLWQEALVDLKAARNLPVRMSDETYARVKERLLQNNPIACYVSGLATYEEFTASIEEDESRLGEEGLALRKRGHSLTAIIDLCG